MNDMLPILKALGLADIYTVIRKFFILTCYTLFIYGAWTDYDEALRIVHVLIEC